VIHGCGSSLDWWIDPKTGFAISERAGVIRFMVRRDPDIHWFDSFEDAKAFNQGPIGVKSVTFVPALASDNPYTTTDYLSSLQTLDLVERERLLVGNWNIRYTAGTFFNVSKLQTVDAPPIATKKVRYWDRAATLNGGDWTVGALLSRDAQGYYFIEDIVRGQWDPGGVMEVHQGHC
jgi:hypothetical protein